jgi:transcriptional regulator with PAS, ATPase and Fis domain
MNPDQIPTKPEDLIEFLASSGLEESEIIKQEQKFRQSGRLPANACSYMTLKYLNQFITQDSEMIAMKERVKKVAMRQEPVLILGETGTGKELIARALHGGRTGRFVPVNTTSLPDLLLESEMFGYKRGAFTGADQDKVGLMTCARDGTLFLDEIGDMPLALQAKLLRVLQEMQIRRVGDTEFLPVNFRLVCATNKDIAALFEKGLFREDLYYRISTVQVHLSSLLSRPSDIPLIAESINPKFPRDYSWGGSLYSIRGNVRAIQQIVKRWEIFGELP